MLEVSNTGWSPRIWRDHQVSCGVFLDSLDTLFGRELYLKNTPRSCDELRQNGSGWTAKAEGHRVIDIGGIRVYLDGGGAGVDREVGQGGGGLY